LKWCESRSKLIVCEVLGAEGTQRRLNPKLR